MGKINKLTKQGETVYPVTVTDAVVNPTLKVESSKLIEEVNISNVYPTGGTDGTDKYTLETAIAKVGAELRHAGLKVTFLNAEGKTETWEYQGEAFASAASWRKRDAVAIVQELGDGENAVVSQKAVTDSINNVVLELNNKTSLLETEDTYNPIFVSGGINVDGEESNFTNRIRTNNYFKGNGGNVTIICSNNAYKCRYFSYNPNKEYIGYGGEFTGEFTIKTIHGNFYRFVILKTDETDISVQEFGHVGFSIKGDGFDLENNSIIGFKKPLYKEDIKHTETIVNNIGNYFDIIDSVFYNTVDTEWDNNTYYDNYGVKKDSENWETTLVDVSGEINNTIVVHTYNILGGYSGFLDNENTCLCSFQINGTSIVAVPDKSKYLFVSNRTSNPSRYISVFDKKYSNTLLSLLSNKFYGFKTEKKLLFNFKQGSILNSGEESEPTSSYYGNRITTNNYFKSKGGNIVISCNNRNYKYRIASYNDNINFISISNDFAGITNYASQKGYYYRFVLLKADNTNITIEDLDDIGFYVDPTNIDDECLFTGFKNTDHKNNLLGKKVTFIGDSITAGYGSNDNPYHKIFCDIYGAIDNALGVNSTCIANNVKNGTSEDRFVNRATVDNLKFMPISSIKYVNFATKYYNQVNEKNKIIYIHRPVCRSRRTFRGLHQSRIYPNCAYRDEQGRL